MLTFYKIDLISSKGTIMTVFVRVQFSRRNRTSNLHAGMSLSRKLFYLSVSWRGKPFKNCKADVYHFSAECKTSPIGGSDTCIWYEFWYFICSTMKAERLINQKGKKRWKVGFHFGHQSFGKQYLNPGSGGPAWSHNNGFHNRPECKLLSFNLSLHDVATELSTFFFQSWT